MSLFSRIVSGSKPGSRVIPSLLDAINYTASLVSNPRNVDVILDQVRTVTSELQPGQQPSPAQESVLCKVYFELENYLATKEPLRAFTKTEVRRRLSPELLAKITAAETATNHKQDMLH